jgi:RNA-directed DNA polymerase
MRVFERNNLFQALKRVEGNGGAPGIDGMTVQELRPWLKEHWLAVRAAQLTRLCPRRPTQACALPMAAGGLAVPRHPLPGPCPVAPENKKAAHNGRPDA